MPHGYLWIHLPQPSLAPMLCDRLIIRPSRPEDQSAILSLERKAFGRAQEARLVDQLIPAPQYTISLVAECDGQIIGHVLLTEIGAPVKALALAPLAVSSDYREMQVGSALVRAAIETAKAGGFDAIFVLGDVLYYERFGFSGKLADPFSVRWQGRHFMALELRDGVLKGRRGKLEYPEPFLQ